MGRARLQRRRYGRHLPPQRRARFRVVTDVMSELREVGVVDALRPPIGRWGGALATVRADDLAAFAIRELIARTNLDPGRIDDVFWGCANQAGEDNRNVARMAALLAGVPVSVAGTTVNRLCASGLQAVMDAARGIA